MHVFGGNLRWPIDTEFSNFCNIQEKWHETKSLVKNVDTEIGVLNNNLKSHHNATAEPKFDRQVCVVDISNI